MQAGDYFNKPDNFKKIALSVVLFLILAAVIFVLVVRAHGGLDHGGLDKSDPGSAADQDQQIFDANNGQTNSTAAQLQSIKLGDKSSSIAALTAGQTAAVSNIPVLMYHYIGDLPDNADATRKDLTVSTANFTVQMDYLKQQGYHSVTTSQMAAYIKGDFKLPLKPVMITLDDGYLDAFQNAVPVLLKDGFQASFAVITAYPDHYNGYAGWQVIKAAQTQGMEIVAHTQHHIDLQSPKYSYVQKLGELIGSVNDIEKNPGVRPVAVVYPFGHYDSDVIKILEQNGIEFAFTTAPGLFSTAGGEEHLLSEPRVRVHGAETLEKFEKSLLPLAAKPVQKTQPLATATPVGTSEKTAIQK